MKLELKGISKSYGDIEALKDVSIDFEEGVYAILGPNGAGKSTLINILTCNLMQSSGIVEFCGKSILDDRENYLSNVGYVPQQQAMFRDFRVSFYLGYMASLKGISRAETETEIDRVLSLVALSEKKNRRISTLSGGMKQRLLIAQALLGNPGIIIFDEPANGLDPKQRILFRRLVSDIAPGKIIIIATHIVGDVEFISNNLIMLNKGEIIRSGDRDGVVSLLDGKVFEAEICHGDFELFQKKYRVIDYLRKRNIVLVRFLSDEYPEIESCRTVEPTLDDVFFASYEIGIEDDETD